MDGTRTARILVLGGDHIGPEVAAAGVEILRLCAEIAGMDIAIETDLLGGASWDVHHSFCTDDVLAKAQAADAVLVGSVGGPEWDEIVVTGPVTEQDGLIKLRVGLGVYNALRPARSWKSLHAVTPFRASVIDGADVLVVRENAGGSYFGEPRGTETLADGQVRAFEMSEYRTPEVERIARCAFEAAGSRRGRVASLDKANVMETGRLWRDTVARIGREEYPDIELEHLYMDYALYALCVKPKEFDVIVTDNLFGDLVSDMTGALAGSLGMLPSASLPGPGRVEVAIGPAIFEPAHGSAPDIAGTGIANPIGSILSVAMMFQYAFARSDVATAIESAVERTLDSGIRTPDIGGTATTAAITDAVKTALLNQANERK